MARLLLPAALLLAARAFSDDDAASPTAGTEPTSSSVCSDLAGVAGTIGSLLDAAADAMQHDENSEAPLHTATAAARAQLTQCVALCVGALVASRAAALPDQRSDRVGGRGEGLAVACQAVARAAVHACSVDQSQLAVVASTMCHTQAPLAAACHAIARHADALHAAAVTAEAAAHVQAMAMGALPSTATRTGARSVALPTAKELLEAGVHVASAAVAVACATTTYSLHAHSPALAAAVCGCDGGLDALVPQLLAQKGFTVKRVGEWRLSAPPLPPGLAIRADVISLHRNLSVVAAGGVAWLGLPLSWS